MSPETSGAYLLLLCLLSPLSRGQESVELVSGDVTLGAIFSVNNIQGGGDCGDYDIDTLKEVVAAQWFLQALNAKGYIPGVRLGLEAYRSCQSGEKAAVNAVHMLEKYRVTDDSTQNINTTQPFLGILGPGRTQEAIVVSRFLSSLPSSQRPLLISGSATGAALTDRTLYSNFFRIIPPDSTQVQVLSKLLQKLGWNYISIVYDDEAYGREAAQQLRDLAVSADLCVPSFAPLPLDYRSQTFITTADAIIDRLRGGDSSIITGVVFIGSVSTAKEFLTRMALRVTYVRFIFSEALGLQTSVVSGTTLGKGALVAAPPYFPLPEFRAFWNSVWTDRSVFTTEMAKSPWMAEYYTTTTGCDISDTSCWTQAQNLLPKIEDDTQWLFEYYQVKATAVFAFTLKRLHAEVCGQGHSGVCWQLKELLRKNRGRIQEVLENGVMDLDSEFSGVSSIFVNQTNVRFDAQGEVTLTEHDDSLYDVFNYRECGNIGDFCFQKVGTYQVGGDLELDTQTLRGYTDSGSALVWPHFPKSQCMDGHDCLDCIPPDLAGHVVFVPGDFYLVVVTPVHDKLASQPLRCGTIRSAAGADLVQGALFALQEVNDKRAPFSGIFGGGRLGLVVLNSCSRELVIKEKLIALHKGTLTLPDGRNSSHIVPHIAGYVGAYFSTISVAMYEVLASLNTRFVMLSPANTSPDLSDRSRYPLYLRLTSGEDFQVTGLLTLVRDLGHQYVQVLYDPDDVYTVVVKERLNILSSQQPFNICVVNNIASDDEDTSFYSVLDNLRKNAWAPLVIVVLQSPHVRKVMADILPLMTPSDTFRFLGTDGWARSREVLAVPGATRLLGSLVLSIELPLNQLFKEYLRNVDPLNTVNPWLKYFWESRNQCYFDGSYQRKNKVGVCPADLTSDYVQSSWVPFYIDAIYAFALGLNSAMMNHCGQASLCESLTSQRLVDAIKGVRLDLTNSGVQVEVFDQNGDGEVGFKVFQVTFDTSTSDSEDVTYEEVGRYERNSLSLDRSSLWIVNNLEKSVCPNAKTCNACFPVPPPSPEKDEQSGGVSSALIGTVVVIVIVTMVAVALVVVLVIACRRLRAQRESIDQAEKMRFDNLSGSRSGESRPLPPIRDSRSSLQETSVGSGSGGSYQQPNAYDYLDADGAPRSARSSHAYLTPRPTGSFSAGSGSGSGGSSARAQPASLNSSGYVTRHSGGQLGYEPANPPYNRLARPPAAQGSAEGGGSPNSQFRGWRPEEGGRQNSRLEDPRRQESHQVGDSLDGDVGPHPVVFENAGLSDDSCVELPPEPCRSSAASGYLTPLSDDYLTPHTSLSNV